MGKIDLKKQQKRESLFESAFELFTEKGFTETSISDIVRNAGVAKGTFYLYFSDKFDLRNKLIAHTGSRIFLNAYRAVEAEGITDTESQILFLTDHILTQLRSSKPLVRFISKNLTWALFKTSLIEAEKDMDDPAMKAFTELLNRLNQSYRNPELMIYMIMEFAASTSYGAILYESPCSLDELTPHLHDIIRYMIRREQKTE